MNGGSNTFVYQVLPLPDLEIETNKANVLKVNYSGYCTLGLTENLPCLLFTSILDKGNVYKSKKIINKLIEINQSKILYDEYYEGEFESLLTYMKAIIEGTEDVKTKLHTFREYVNSKLEIFNYTIRKILYCSTFNNYHNPENQELLKIKFEDLKNKIFAGENLEFSYLIALINELEISVKVVYVDDMKVEDFNFGQEETFVFMKYYNMWYALYSIEDYFLIHADANEFNEIMRKAQRKQIENKTYIEYFKPEVIKLKAQNEKLAEVTGKVLSLLHPNKTINSIQASECPNLDIAEALEQYVCAHCNKTSINQLACGHSACNEVFQSSQVKKTILCYKCKT